MRLSISSIVIFAAALVSGSAALAQTVTVRGVVSVIREHDAGAAKPDSSGAVIWLKPVGGSGDGRFPPAKAHFRIVQQHKRFEPHVLAIPAGSVVDFPNLDPFFHNVFSLFDGKRFDLGLYEAGASHSVTFDRPGVCYVFCNIHPEMSAIVVVTDSPYYAVSNQAGEFTIPNVAPGRYLATVWHERGKVEPVGGFPREVTITMENASLPPIRLTDPGSPLMQHKNKYGHDYDTPPNRIPPYK